MITMIQHDDGYDNDGGTRAAASRSYYSFQVHYYHDNGAEHDDEYGRSYVSDPGVDDKKRNDQKTCFV